MRRYRTISRFARISVGIALGSFAAAGVASACEDGDANDEAASVGEFENAATGGCPTATCETPEPNPIDPPPACTPIPGHTPVFERWPSSGSIPAGTGYNPMIPEAFCYGVAKRSTAMPNGNKYFLLTLDYAFANGFIRAKSKEASQGTIWTTPAPPAVFKKYNGSWFGKIKCPDLHYFSGSDRLHMYFNSLTKTKGFGYAYSDDNGRTWRSPISTNPVLVPSQGWETSVKSPNCNLVIENPSVIEYETTYKGTSYNYLMAYTGGHIVDCGEIGIAYSCCPESGWVKRDVDVFPTDPDNPIIRVGGIGAWDEATVARPRLVADPCDPDVLHIFYSGAAEGSGCNRRSRIGHAYSTNRGQTWVKDFANNPVFDYSGDPLDWDYGTTSPFCPDFVTSDDGLYLDMYYLGLGTDDEQSVGLARALWSDIAPGCDSAIGSENGGMIERAGSNSRIQTVPDGLSFAIVPNPAREEMTLRFALAEAGEVSLRVYDVLGRLVAEPVAGWRNAGTHEVSLSRGGMAFGRYSAVLEVGEARLTDGLTWIR